AVARTHKQPRLLEPLHRAAQMGAVNGQDQELMGFRLVGLALVAPLVADEDAGVSHHAVPRLADWVVESHYARSVLRVVRDGSQRHPQTRRLARPEQVADEGDAHHRGRDSAKPVSQPTQERAPPRTGLRRIRYRVHWYSPPALVVRALARFSASRAYRPHYDPRLFLSFCGVSSFLAGGLAPPPRCQ